MIHRLVYSLLLGLVATLVVKSLPDIADCDGDDFQKCQRP